MISKVLTEDQIKRIHEASLRILERVGVVVPHKEMLNRFTDAGANVDRDKQHVKIPPDVVMSLLEKAGKQFTIYGRDVSRKAEFGYGKRNHNSIAGEALWVDNIGGKRRYSTLADVAAACCCTDALESLNIAGAMADPHEIPVEFPEDWGRYVDSPLTEKELERLRQGVNRQAPYGSPDWQMRISEEHGLESTLRSRGRPAKK